MSAVARSAQVARTPPQYQSRHDLRAPGVRCMRATKGLLRAGPSHPVQWCGDALGFGAVGGSKFVTTMTRSMESRSAVGWMSPV